MYLQLINMYEDEVAEWLRRWTANPLCSARVGSNPILVGISFLINFLISANWMSISFISWISLTNQANRNWQLDILHSLQYAFSMQLGMRWCRFQTCLLEWKKENLKFPPFSPLLRSSGEKPAIFDSVKLHGFESRSNIPFPLTSAKKKTVENLATDRVNNMN